MIVLALDLGTNCGWAIHRGGAIDSGVLRLKTSRKDRPGERWIRFRRELLRLIQGVELVVYERVRRHEGLEASHVYGGLRALLEMVCESQGRTLRTVEVAHVKQHATGKGNATKEAMERSARERGWTPIDDNEADALWILDWAMHGGIE